MAAQVTVDWALAKRLPAKDQQILELSEQGMSQAEVGHNVGLTQVGISWRLKKIAQRLELLARLPTFTVLEIRAECDVLTPLQQEILFRYLRSNCQIEIGRQVGRSQTAVRHAVLKIRKLLHEDGETRYVEAIDLLQANPALLRDWNASGRMGAALRGRTRT